MAASASSVLVIGGNPRGPSPDGPRPEESASKSFNMVLSRISLRFSSS